MKAARVACGPSKSERSPMKRRKRPFGMCSMALLALPLVLTGCAGRVDGEKAAKKSVLNVVVGTGLTWSAPRVLVTRTTTRDDEAGTTSPAFPGLAPAGGGHPSLVNAGTPYGAADALSMTFDDAAMHVHFDPVSIADKAYDLTEAEKDGLKGLAHSLRVAGGDTPDYAQFGVWERANADDLISPNAVPAAIYGARRAPAGAVLTLDSATSIGMTAGIEIENSGEFGVITADVELTANFASASLDNAINGEITTLNVDRRAADMGALPDRAMAQNTFIGTMNVTDLVGRQAVDNRSFDDRFAETRASGWNDAGGDGTKLIGVTGTGAKHEVPIDATLQDSSKTALSL